MNVIFNYDKKIKSIIYQPYIDLKSFAKAFTLVEVLVVITVIGIVATFYTVSYVGSNNKIIETTLKSDLFGAAAQLKLFNMNNEHYPTTISTDCDANPDSETNLCLTVSPGNEYGDYTVDDPSDPQSYTLRINNGSIIYEMTNISEPILI